MTQKLLENNSGSLEMSTHVDERLVDILNYHFHPELGSSFWLAEQSRLSINVCDRIRRVEDLALLGRREPSSLAEFSVWDLIPRDLHKDRCRFVVGETGGTTGVPTPTAYLQEEFVEAFIDPFVTVAKAIGFPQQTQWLFVGPSGPHVIGKAARALANRMSSPDPWAVDFDPRWAKKLVKESLAAKRYLEHVVEQSLTVFQREPIGVLFSTPPVLRRLAEELTDQQRESVKGVHYGGMSITADELNALRTQFPHAVHLSGYGNTLFGCALEVCDTPRLNIDYFPSSERLLFEILLPPDTDCATEFTRGPLMFHRLDRSMFLPNMIERDWAERIQSPDAAIQLGCQETGIRNPAPPPVSTSDLKIGIY